MSNEFFIADTEYGRVRGRKTISVLETEYISFLGIPYAKAPVGELRFKNPVKPSSWSDVYDALEEKPHCLGFISTKVVGCEDGLYLNIFTKSLKPSKLRPVMLYIHGGAFLSGSSKLETYSPDYLLMADIVVVTFNYRVGPLGFLHLDDPALDVAGNAGLKDQLMAMKFVRDNIRSFGGDPDNVTLFGHSAGGCSVSWHCVTKASEKLFARAIVMSGSVLNPCFALTPKRDWAVRLAKVLGYTGDDGDERSVLTFLQAADPVRMTAEQKKVLRVEDMRDIALPFAPHVEPYVTSETFIAKPPLELVRDAWSNDIDILIGGTPDEGLFYLENVREMPQILKSLKLEHMLVPDVRISADDPIRSEFAEKLRQTYYSSSQCADPLAEDELAFCKIQSDRVFLHGLHRTVQGRQNSGGKGKTYLYRFAVDSPTQNFFKVSRHGPNLRGVCHADEVSYLFKNQLQSVPPRSSLEFKTIERFVSVFTSFAAAGNPNANVIAADMEDVDWKPVDTREPPFKCLNIEERLKFEILPEAERLALWDELYKATNSPLY